ncbi:MAG: MMPL family transporter, partial [Bacteroidia bacterium]|nr:MMPL family transporter [Bacteroidia bacterium]
IGFGVFYFTKSNILMEFGLIAALNIMATYAISLILIPIIFSYLAAPKIDHIKHLKSKRTNFFLEFIDRLVHEYTNWVHASVAVLVLLSIIGIIRINAVGYVVDDLPKNDPVYVDLQFFEKHFKGILPLEILIDTKKKKGLNNHKNLALIYKLQKRLAKKDELSRSISVVDGIKYAYQSYRGGNPKAYILPGALEMNKLSKYVDAKNEKSDLLNAFVDSTKQTARVSVQVADIGSKKMGVVIDELNKEIEAIFDPVKYNTTITGNSLIFLKGNAYLVSNLVQSIILAIILISIIMIMLFMSVRMILVSILPSLIPLIITAGLMGYFQIPLKPSTILIYSIAFGISSDGTIYFLTRYRHDMRYYSLSISRTVSRTIRETGLSMVYTAVILFAGFFIFTASGFGGTQSLGILISLTLMVAMISNLVFLPALLISLERKLTTKAFLNEPIIDVFTNNGNDGNDEKMDDIDIKKVNNGTDTLAKPKSEV